MAKQDCRSRRGSWRTRFPPDKLLLLFLCFLMTLCTLGSCAALPPVGDRGQQQLRHWRDPRAAAASGGNANSNAAAGILVPAAAAAGAAAGEAAGRGGAGTPRHRRTNASRHSRNPPASRTSRRFRKPPTTPHTINPRNTGYLPVMCFDDVPSKTYLADTVFEGKARSRSPVKNGVYNVTFVVVSVFKGSGEVGQRSPVRLQFAEKGDGEAECPQTQQTSGARGAVKANIKTGGKYVVFVDQVGPHSFMARGEPAARSKLNVQAVKSVLCPNCVRKPLLSELSDVSRRVNEKLRLVCRTRGNPFPALHWFKDGVRVHNSKDTKIRNKKRRTTLVVSKARLSDAGVYECRAYSATGATDRISALVTIHSQPRQDNATIAWRVARQCPIDHYCMNEGTCTYYDTVGELSCACAEGFKGTRCEEKDAYNRANGNGRRDSWIRYDVHTRMTAYY